MIKTPTNRNWWYCTQWRNALDFPEMFWIWNLKIRRNSFSFFVFLLFLLPISTKPLLSAHSTTFGTNKACKMYSFGHVLCLIIQTVTSPFVSVSQGEMSYEEQCKKSKALWKHWLLFFCVFSSIYSLCPLSFPLYNPHFAIYLCYPSVFLHPFPLFSIYSFLLSASLSHAHTQTWHTFEQSIPLLNNTSFISLGLFSLACFKQRGEMGF